MDSVQEVQATAHGRVAARVEINRVSGAPLALSSSEGTSIATPSSRRAVP